MVRNTDDLLISSVTVSSNALTIESFEFTRLATGRFEGDPLSALSTLRRFGQLDPQLMARRRLPPPWTPTAPSLVGRGDEETIRWARAGFRRPMGVLLDAPATEKRSHSSREGSTWGDFSASRSWLTFTEGVLEVWLLGDEVGDELRARFWPRRVDESAPAAWSLSLCHRRRSLGDTSSVSSFGKPPSPIKSFHASRAIGVVILAAGAGGAIGDRCAAVGKPRAGEGAGRASFSLSSSSSMVITSTSAGSSLRFDGLAAAGWSTADGGDLYSYF